MQNTINSQNQVNPTTNHACCSDSIKPVDHNCAHANQQTSTSIGDPIASTPKINNTQKDLASSFSVMGIGMLGIFLFMFVFFLVIKGLDKAFPGK